MTRRRATSFLLLVLAVFLAAVFLAAWLLRTENDTAPPTAPGSELPRVQDPASPAVVDAPRSERIPIAPDPESAPPTSIEVRVRTETGEPVAGATVRFVKPAFNYFDLPLQQRERYSRSTEEHLREFGLCQTTDESGSTWIPIAAAFNGVVARKGNLYGASSSPGSAKIVEIRVSVHHTLVVETVDAFGKPVPHVKVLCQRFPFAMFESTLGTTDDNGRLTHVLKSPSGPTPKRMSIYAELLDGNHGREEIDPTAPPTYPVQLIIPTTGMVRARIVYANGVTLEPEFLGALHAALLIVGGPTAKPTYARLDAEGHACFENVPLDKTLHLSFPSQVINPKAFRGPSESERVVTIVKTIEPDHPFVVGTLLGSDNKPIVREQFAIFCRREGDLLASVGGKTDERGRFAAYLSDVCIDKSAVVFTLGMDMQGAGFAREARVPVVGALRGRVDLGEVVMPDKK